MVADASKQASNRGSTLGVLIVALGSVLFENNDLVHVEHDCGTCYLACEVRAQLRGLGVLDNGAGQGHRDGEVAALAAGPYKTRVRD